MKYILTALLILLAAQPAFADRAGSIFSPAIRAEVQEALSHYGFDAGPADGVWGRQTQAAISAYQTLQGGRATGDLSRVGVSNLLARYREDRRAAESESAQNELPAPVQASITALAQDCEMSASAVLSKPGAVQAADLNNDDISDYILDASTLRCSSMCGAAGCAVTVIVSTLRGYRENHFLGSGVTERSFNCLSSGLCEFAR